MRSYLRYKDYLRYAGKIFYKRNSFPVYFIHFVTENCNARCLHCLLGERERKEDELRLDEIEKISGSMPEFLFLLLTGGEPFLREDIPEIVDIYARNNSVRRCLIPSNGSMTEKIVAAAEEILGKHKELSFGIDVSIDSYGGKHDLIRQAPGLFEKAIATYKELGKLTRRYKNFDRAVTITVSKNNQGDLLDTYNYLVDVLGVENIGIRYTRGNPRDTQARDIDLQKYIELIKKVEMDMQSSRVQGFRGFPFSSFVNAEQSLAHEFVVHTLRHGIRMYPCYAGTLTAVMRSSGEVYPCELLSGAFGNVRDAGYDFKKIWFSQKAKQIRKYIKEKRCCCTHENFYTNNILFNPWKYGIVFKRWVRLNFRRYFSKEAMGRKEMLRKGI